MSNTSEWSFPSGGNTGQGENAEPATQTERPIGGHDTHRGRPRSWVLVAVVIAAFWAGGIAVIEHLWPLFWACVGVTVLAIPVGKVIGIMDDTVEVRGRPRDGPPAADPGTVADPGVRVR